MLMDGQPFAIDLFQSENQVRYCEIILEFSSHQLDAHNCINTDNLLY